nr:putative Gag-polypeptide of LTR copia-type [Tanacetum cinerariifolium]
MSAHHIPHNLFKSSNQATMSGKATKSGDDLSLRLTNLLKNGFNNQPQNPKLSDNLQINLELNNQDYTLWTRMIRVAIDGKSKALLSHLTSDAPEQSSNLTKYHTAKTLWDALVITCNRGREKLQTFNLHVKANDIKQNKTHLKCGNCGMTRHNTKQCFELIGYPDWWNDGHKKGNKNRGPKRGKASTANTDMDRKSPTGFEGMAATTINEEDESFSMSTAQNYNINKKQSWIFDSKSHRKTFKPNNIRVDLPFSLIHSDVMLSHGTTEREAIQISENPVQHDRTKHIEIDRHFTKEKLEAEIITLPIVRSQDQVADILTKAVNEITLHEFLGKLNFENPTIQLEGEC